MGDCSCLAKLTFPTSGLCRKELLLNQDAASGKVIWGLEAREQKGLGWSGQEARGAHLLGVPLSFGERCGNRSRVFMIILGSLS